VSRWNLRGSIDPRLRDSGAPRVSCDFGQRVVRTCPDARPMSAMPGEPRPSAASKPHAASLVPHSLHRQRAPGTTASLVGQRCAGLSPVQRTGSVKSLPILGGLCPGLGFRYAHGSLSPRIQRTELLWMRLLVKGALLRQRRGYEQTLRLRSFALWRLKPPECRIRSASAESSHQLPMSGYVWHEPDQPGRSGDVR